MVDKPVEIIVEAINKVGVYFEGKFKSQFADIKSAGDASQVVDALGAANKVLKALDDFIKEEKKKLNFQVNGKIVGQFYRAVENTAHLTKFDPAEIEKELGHDDFLKVVEVKKKALEVFKNKEDIKRLEIPNGERKSVTFQER